MNFHIAYIHGRPWTLDEIAELKNRIWSDQTVPIAAKRMGRSEKSVYNKCRELGLKRAKVWTDERKCRLEQLWAEGKTCAEIGAELGTTKNAVIGMAHRTNLPQRGNPGPRAPRKPRIKVNVHVRVERFPEPPVGNAFESEFALPFCDAKRNQCHFPLGEPSYDMLVCGANVSPKKPYCARHCRIAYKAPRRFSETFTADAARRFSYSEVLHSDAAA